MANTHHTGIPKLQWVGAYPPCTPSASISVDLSPFCAGDSVMFTPTLNCVENVIIASYAWVVNGVIKSTSPDPFVTTELFNNDKVYFLFIANENTYVSNVITVVEKTEGCEEPIEPVKYGLLYNWYAATDVRELTSAGWNVMNQSEWDTFISYLGGSGVAGGKLKEISTTYWDSPNVGATNEFGFNARGNGILFEGTEEGLRQHWSSHIKGLYDNGYGEYPAMYYIYYQSNDIVRYMFDQGRWAEHGGGIRPFRLASEAELLLPDGPVPVIYTGNDEKQYGCTKIGTYIIIANDLAETKFRNGDWIHGFDGGIYTPISDGDWAALDTAALRAYDDDWNNV